MHTEQACGAVLPPVQNELAGHETKVPVVVEKYCPVGALDETQLLEPAMDEVPDVQAAHTDEEALEYFPAAHVVQTVSFPRP